MNQVILWALFAYTQAYGVPDYRIQPVGLPKHIGDAPQSVKIKFPVKG